MPPFGSEAPVAPDIRFIAIIWLLPLAPMSKAQKFRCPARRRH